MAGPGEASAAAVTARERTEGQALAGRRAACMLDEAMVGRARLGAAVGMHRRAGWSGSMHTTLVARGTFLSQTCSATALAYLYACQQQFIVAALADTSTHVEARHESAI